MVGLLSVSGLLGAAPIVLLGVAGEDAQVIHLKTPPQVKGGDREPKRSRNCNNGCGEFRAKSPKSHPPLGLRAFQPGSCGCGRCEILHSCLVPCCSSVLLAHIRSQSGLLGPSLQRLPRLKLNKEKLPIFFFFFVSAPASGKWQRAGGRRTKQGGPGQKKNLLTSEAFPCFLSPPPLLQPLSLPVLAAP